MDSETRVRQRLEKALRRPLPDFIWEALSGAGYVEDAGVVDEEGYRALEDAARRYLEEFDREVDKRAPSRRPIVPSERHHPIPLKFTSEDMAWIEAVSEHLATCATEVPSVVDFRERVLEGKLLSPREADKLLTSPAAALMSLARFQRLGIPLLDHKAKYTKHKWGHRRRAEVHDVEVQIEWDGRTHTEARRGLEDVDVSGVIVPFGLSAEWDSLIQWEWHGVFRGSVLAELLPIAEELADAYSWKEAQAVRFVLTGKRPMYQVMRGEVVPRAALGYYLSHVKFELAPWLSADTLLRAYRWAQQHALGNNHRRPSLRTLEVLRFVARRFRERKHKPWRVLLNQWNSKQRQRPEWRYDDVRHFAQAVRRGKQAIHAYHPDYLRTGTREKRTVWRVPADPIDKTYNM